MIIESASKFIASVIASTSPITKDGFNALISRIHDFQIIPREKPEANTKKELPVGGYELAMGLFKGLEKRG